MIHEIDPAPIKAGVQYQNFKSVITSPEWLAWYEKLHKTEFFPVGSLYGTLTYTNPATILGYGTWILVIVNDG